MHCQSLSRCCPYNPDCWRSKTIQQISSFTTQPYPSQLKVDNYNTSVRHSPHLVHQQNVLYALSSHFAMLSLRIDLLAFEDYTTCKLIHSPASPFTQPRLYIYNTSPSPSPLHQQTKTQSYKLFKWLFMKSAAAGPSTNPQASLPRHLAVAVELARPSSPHYYGHYSAHTRSRRR
jgi:hypothetical protein